MIVSWSVISVAVGFSGLVGSGVVTPITVTGTVTVTVDPSV